MKHQEPLKPAEELEQLNQSLETLQKKSLKESKLSYVQIQSDKLELMRDLATYEANACDNLGINTILQDVYTKVSTCLNQIQGHTIETEKFSEQLYLNVEDGVKKI